jgi:RNA polymerase sigma-70 factor (ECF subfamily)
VISVIGRETELAGPSSIAQSGAVQFATLVEPHLPKMFHLAERRVGADNRDDVVQEALINAWKKREQFDARRGSLGSWLMAIVADQARKSWRRPLARGWRIPTSVEASPDDRLDIERAVRALPPRQKLAVDCYYFSGLSVAETAAVMRCSEGTVKSTLSDARARLRPALEVYP